MDHAQYEMIGLELGGRAAAAIAAENGSWIFIEGLSTIGYANMLVEEAVAEGRDVNGHPLEYLPWTAEQGMGDFTLRKGMAIVLAEIVDRYGETEAVSHFQRWTGLVDEDPMEPVHWERWVADGGMDDMPPEEGYLPNMDSCQ